MILWKNYIIEDVIKLSNESHYQDVNIICHNGNFRSNSFLLATLFPMFRKILNTSIQDDDLYVICMPDMDKNCLENFCSNLSQKSPRVPNIIIQQLLEFPFNIKEEITENEPDYCSLDDFIETEDNDCKNLTNISNDNSLVTVKIKKEGEDFNGKSKPQGKKNSSREKDSGLHPKDIFAQVTKDFDIHFEVLNEGKEVKYKCKQCSYVIGKKWNIARHYICNHLSDGGVSCDICGTWKKSLMALEYHKKYKHSIEGQTICSTCKKSFPHNDFPNHDCNQFICNDCGKILKTEASLGKHIQNVHRINERTHFCNICGKGFRHKRVLKSHIDKVHENKNQRTPCPECGQNVVNLRSHMRSIHTPDDQKTCQCQHCGKGFWEQHSLDKHIMNMHLKLRPYNCRYGCEISYNDVSNRNHHEKRKHGKYFISIEEEKMKERMKHITQE